MEGVCCFWHSGDAFSLLHKLPHSADLGAKICDLDLRLGLHPVGWGRGEKNALCEVIPVDFCQYCCHERCWRRIGRRDPHLRASHI